MATSGIGSGGALLLVGALLTLFSSMPKSTATKMSDVGLSPARDLYDSSNMNGICKSIDIRNTLKSFENLNGCRVVEGFVQILLFDNVNESAFNNISFPLLTEITDFLLLYRVNGLRSVGQLFPNLAVIRGQDNVFQYSLVIYEMSSLQEIGLRSLTDITAGLIRIDKNPSLCYVNSIDWDLIAHEKGDHFIKSVKAENECPLCPGDDGLSDTIQCPPSTNKNNIGRYLCWNRQHCQKVCPKECENRTCDSNGRCCDEKCLGGCNINNATQCQVCRSFSGWEDGQCLLDCPSTHFEYLGRRCITREECITTKRPLKLHSKIQHEYPYKIFRKSCLLECPANYMDNTQHTCEPCRDRCKKECQGTVIDSIESAQQLRGCTHINGSLEIQIRGGKNVVNALEENLSMVEVIDGYIKVVRSFPLVSLNFLKNLKTIRGNSLENQKYVFIVLDNQNLQEIWNWTNRTLQIDKGRLFFHFNPKLCIDKIKKLRENAQLENFNDLEVAPNSNGDKTACNVTELIVNVTKKHSKSLVLKWSQFTLRDHRKLLGYLIYSIEAPHNNITLYDGRDACGGDGWRVDDVQVQDQNNPTYLLSQLKPYTQYAYYVKTYTVASETTGAQSKIEYERTLPYQPSLPIEIKTDTLKQYHTLRITWKPPLQPNGNVTYYIVTGVNKTTDRAQILKGRNACIFTPIRREPLPETTKPNNNNTCDCGDNDEPHLENVPKYEEQRNNQITFEDALINFVYVKRQETKDSSRRKRSEPIPFPNSTKGDAEVIKNDSEQVENVTDKNHRYLSFNFTVKNGSTELQVMHLKHYTDYEIKIQACREKEGDDDNHKYCSETAQTFARTEMKAGANQVQNVNTNQSMSSVTISWDEPSDPNGCIVAYRIEYRRVDIVNAHPVIECHSALEYLNNSKKISLKSLNPGNYSLRISAWSQIDNPIAHEEYSPYTYFVIEEQSDQSTLSIIIVALVIFFIIFGIGYFVLQKKYSPDRGIKLNPSVNPEYVSTVYEPDEWEVQRDKIKLIKELGQGSFGMVYEGSAKDIKGKAQTRCAIKTVNEHATNRERIEFLNEASVMKAFDTAHVVRLLGVVSQGQPTLVVMELMANGDLKSYLRSHRPDLDSYSKGSTKQPPTLRRILQMAIEIADGMAYLAAKKFVHRDLAARNCMVAEELTVKIGDFGMTRDIYETDYYRKGTKGLLPVRWMAPESLRDGLFSSSSDVWSYGVVLWEMATLASQPYQGLSNDQVLRYVIDGGIMERPENCPDKLYDLMICCWRHNPGDRPNFLHLCSMLLEDASTTFSQLSFYHSAAGMEARNAKPVQNHHQDDPTTPLRMKQIGIDSSEESDTELEANGYVSNGTMP